MTFDTSDRSIVTSRLTLVPARDDFGGILRDFYLDNRSHLQPWEPLRSDSFFDLNEIHRRLHSMEANSASGNALHLFLFLDETGELVGECNFTNIARGPFQACHLGFSLGRRFEGKGLMYEALATAIPYVFASLGLHRVMANYRPENVRSGRLLQRLGFEREGLARSYLKINGVWTDHVLTSVINEGAGN